MSTLSSSSLYNGVLSQDSIRLLKFGEGPRVDLENQILQFEIEEMLFDQAPLYDALSYRWEDPDPRYPHNTILCNDIETHVGHNLYLALLQVAVTEDRSGYIWVDFLCIDQSNDEEKQVQILLMPQVYSKAHAVIIWLGPADVSEGSDEAMDYFPLLVDLLDLVDKPSYGPNDQPLSEEDIRLRDQFLSNWNVGRDPRSRYMWKLLNRSWFSRAWTLQEAALASNNCVVKCGNKSMPYHVLRHFVSKVRSDTVGHWLAAHSAIKSGDLRTDAEHLVLPSLRHSAIVWRMRQALDEASHLVSWRSSMIRVLDSLRLVGCKDPKDRIFSVSAFLPKQLIDDLRARGPISTEDLYIRFAEIELGVNKNVLCLAAAGLCQQRYSYPQKYVATSTRPNLQLPSWVPDWTFCQINAPLYTIDLTTLESSGHHLYEATKTSVSDVHIMTDAAGLKVASVQGYMFDEIFKVSRPFRIHDLSNASTSAEKTQLCLDMFLDYQQQINGYVALAQEHFRAHNGSSTSHQLTLIRQTLIGSMLPATSGIDDPIAYSVRSQRDQIDPMFEDFEEDLEEVKWMHQTLSGQNSNAQTDDQHSTVESKSTQSDPDRPRSKYNVISAVSSMCKGRLLFVTVDGTIGIGPDISQMGDRICVFHGSCTPSIVRAVELQPLGNADVCYQLVGECYVHGCMDGEVMERDDVVSEYIRLV